MPASNESILACSLSAASRTATEEGSWRSLSISTGAFYDYGTDGMTHHGTADMPILKNLPGMQIVVPRTSEVGQLYL